MTIEDTQLGPADDHPYSGAIDPNGLWAEAQQWNLVDAAGNGVIYHLCTMPHQIHLRHNVLAITLADGTVYALKVVGPSSEPEQFGVDFLHSRTVEPFRRWRLHLDGAVQRVNPELSTVGFLPDGPHVPARIDLELTAAHPVWIPGERAGEDADSLFNVDYVFHHEQPFRANGTIEVEGRTITINDAVGHRDHSRGERTAVYNPVADTYPVQSSFWMNGIFDSGWAFATMEGIFDPGGRFERSALFTDDGITLAELDDWARLTSTLADPTDFTINLRADNSTVRTVNIHCTNGMNFTGVGPSEWCLGADLTNPNSYVWAMYFAELECDGERGLGFVDRSTRARNLQARG